MVHEIENKSMSGMEDGVGLDMDTKIDSSKTLAILR